MKIIAKEVNPAYADFSTFFDGDCFTSACGENYAIYIPGDRQHLGFNNAEYTGIQDEAQEVIADDTSDPNVIADFLTTKTGKKWTTKYFTGYSQGDYCTLVYCADTYTDTDINMIGKMWLGCGAEFCIDDCYGYFVEDTTRWDAGETLRKELATQYGCAPEDLEVQLYTGSHTVDEYEVMEA